MARGTGFSQRLAVQMKGVTKIYPDGVLALNNVDFEVLEGEVHALLGENGAGKTTLMRILYGEIKPTKGEIRLWGRRVELRNPRDALANGVSMVYQNFTLIPNFTVFENIYLALSSITSISRSEARMKLHRLMEDLGFKVPLDAIVEELPVGLQQKVEVLKALALGARLLILDEPTSILTPIESRALFDFIRTLRNRGVTVILITHKLREVKMVADRVTVLRRGRVVGVFNVDEVSEVELAKLMVGKEVELTTRRTGSGGITGDALLVEDLHVRDDRGLMRVRGVTFKVSYGEIIGIAGVQGNGQKELLEAIAGLRRVERGRIVIDGVDVTRAPPEVRRDLGLSYIPDSRSEGLALLMSLAENSVLSMIAKFTGRLYSIRWGYVEDYARRVVGGFNVVHRTLWDPVLNLSGGNQQRLMVGREILRNPRILLAHEPTQGLDVASANFIRSKLLELRDKGAAIILVSSDIDEVLGLSDRILVISDGVIVGEGRPEDMSEERLGLLMGGIVEATR